MLAVTVAPELALPWESSLDEDRRFIRILRSMLLALLVLAIIVPFLPVSEPQWTKPEPVVEHLARIILEKKELPKVVPVVPKPKPKAKRRRKTKAKPKTTATPKPKAKTKRKQHQWSAAEKAAIGKRMKAYWAKRRKAKQ